MNCMCQKSNIESYENFELKNFNTLKMSSVADVAYFVKNEAQLCSLFEKHEKLAILGAGSNVLLSSLGVREPVVITKKMSEISFRKNIVEVEAGASAQKLSVEAFKNSLGGFEFLIGLPATLGGAVAMNAGAHEQCISDFLISARVYDTKERKILNFTKEDFNFSYRNSIVKQNPQRYVVLSAKFELKKTDKSLIQEKMEKNTAFRKKVQPSLALPNLGSVFKNPTLPSGEKLSAGLLVDKCGLKGYRSGGAGVWENHGNFVINYDNCSSSDYTNVVYKMYDSVREKFDIELECEIVRLGEFSESEEEKWKTMRKD